MSDFETKREHKTPLSLEQAGNYLKEKMETASADMKAEAKKAPISVNNPDDTKRYLLYCVSLLEDVPEHIKNRWCFAANKAPGMYATKEVARIFKQLLVARIYGYSLRRIAMLLHTTIPVVEQTEKLANDAVKAAIMQRRLSGIPIIGGAS